MVRMRTLIILSVLVSMLIFTTACQPTPGSAPVIGLQGDILGNDSTNPIDVPEHVSEVFDNFAKLKVTFDADVFMPKTTAYPVTDVQKRIISDEEILSFIKLLAGKNDELYSRWDLTKDEWMQKLTIAKRYEGTERVTPDMINNLQNKVDNAASNVNNPLLNIADLPTDIESQIYVKTGNEVSVFSLIRNGNTFSYFRNMDIGIIGKTMYESNSFDSSLDTIEHYKWLQPDEPEISQEDAYSKALVYMKELNIDLDLYSAEPCT